MQDLGSPCPSEILGQQFKVESPLKEALSISPVPWHCQKLLLPHNSGTYLCH